MRRTRGGYTIIEVLVVLAVGTIIFFAAIALFAGKQGKTQFAQAMRDLESQMQSIVNDVGVSLFPLADSVNCSLNGSGRPMVDSANADAGTNQDCMFLGKAVVIDNSSDPNKLKVYTVLGSRLDGGGNVIGQITASNFTDANPEPFTVVNDGSTPDLTETYNIPSGATVVSAKTDDDTGASQTRMVGFYNGQQSATQQGSLSLLTLGYSGVNVTAPGQVQTAIRSAGDSIKSWTLCIQSGTSDEMSKLIVSSSAAGISTAVIYGACT